MNNTQFTGKIDLLLALQDLIITMDAVNERGGLKQRELEHLDRAIKVYEEVLGKRYERRSEFKKRVGVEL